MDLVFTYLREEWKIDVIGAYRDFNRLGHIKASRGKLSSNLQLYVIQGGRC
jgi:hypothetical protein